MKYTVFAWLVMAPIAFATPVRFDGTDFGPVFFLHIYQEHGSFQQSAVGTLTRTLDVSIDPVGPQSLHNFVEYDLSQPATLTWTTLRANGVGFVNITTTVTLAPVSISKGTSGPFALTPHPNLPGQLLEPLDTIDNPASFDPYTPVAVTGSYTISGPTQTFSGTFAHSFRPTITSDYVYDVSNFPTKVIARRDLPVVFTDTSNLVLFNGNVDGVPWDIAVNSLVFDGDSAFTTTLLRVPEPSSMVLAALGLLGLAAWGWRRPERTV